MMELKDELRLILALNGALIGEITENIRSVSIRRNGNDIVSRFVFFAPPSEDEIETMGFIGTEVLSNFRDETGTEIYEVKPRGHIERQVGEYLVFKRKEEEKN